MGKSPAFQFYPADWLNDIKLQTCNMSAQGVLINMMCLMHQSENYGYLLINGSIPDHKTIIKLLRTHHRTFINSVNQLLLCGALKQTEDGIYYCERMVKDEYIRKVRRESGLKGGNPNLKLGKPNPYYLDKQKDKQKITPSSSSSSSSSLKNKDGKPEKDPAPKINKLGNWIDENPGMKIYLKKFSETSWPKIRTAIGEALKKNKHQGAIKDLIIYIHGRKIDKPNDYFWKTINIISGNYYANENEKEHKKTKAQEFPDLKSIFDNMLKEIK